MGTPGKNATGADGRGLDLPPGVNSPEAGGGEVAETRGAAGGGLADQRSTVPGSGLQYR